MEGLLAWQNLEQELKALEPWQTVLNIDLAGHHPDDGFSLVPYNKGALLLKRVEECVGREALDPVLEEWFSAGSFQSRSTDEWRKYLLGAFPDLPEQMDLEDNRDSLAGCRSKLGPESGYSRCITVCILSEAYGTWIGNRNVLPGGKLC